MLMTTERSQVRPTSERMLAGRTAIVTGSTSGIGFGIAEALASHGANIVLNGFGDINGFALAAAENWTNTAAGTAVGFITTPLGTTTSAEKTTAHQLP